MSSTSSTNMTDYCKKILALDPLIRFAGKIVNDHLVSSARKDGVIDGILILSTEPTADHHAIIEKIKNLKD